MKLFERGCCTHPHEAVIAKDERLLRLVPLSTGAAHVDKAERVEGVVAARQRRHSLDARDGVVARDGARLLPCHSLQV